jgi:hypothetical protein
MFDAVEERKGGVPWGILGAVAAFGVLLAAGYMMIT